MSALINGVVIKAVSVLLVAEVSRWRINDFLSYKEVKPRATQRKGHSGANVCPLKVKI